MNLAVASFGHRTEDLYPFINFEQTRRKGILLGWVSVTYHCDRVKSEHRHGVRSVGVSSTQRSARKSSCCIINTVCQGCVFTSPNVS